MQTPPGIPSTKRALGSLALILTGMSLVACPSDDGGDVGADEVGTDSSSSSSDTGPGESSSSSSSTDDMTTDPTDSSTTDTSTTDPTDGQECGNGLIEGSEVCDTGDLGGESCQSQGFGGGGLTCLADCTGFDTTQCTDCGNGMVDGDEQCDGADLGMAATCFDLNLGTMNEPLGCNADCTYDFGMCSGCGDAVITDPEECEPAGPLLDKDELNGATCQSLGFDDGLLACSMGCTFDTFNCYSCGDAVQQGNEQCDGADFGALTCADFVAPNMAPFDSGSLSCVDDCSVDTSNCSLCGDGVVSGAEVCEPGVLEGETCGSQGFDDGSLGCLADCSGYDTSACTDCGDGMIEGNEQCEGNDLAGESCNGLGFAGGGNLACTAGCLFDTSGCSNEFCGDGVKNGNDQCDCGNQGVNCTAAQLGNASCVSQGFSGGALQCNSPNNCQFNTSQCFSCGDGNINPGEQCDGANLGGATCVSQGFAGGGTLTCNNSCGFNTAQCVNVPNPYTLCVNPNQAITGAGPGINNPSNINVPVAGTVTDVNVSINALHTWPGDLDFRVIHNGVSRYVIDNPGQPASTFGCATDNITVTLDDEAAGGPVENVCNANPPGINGTRTPNNPLNGFDAGSMQGNWSLVIDDSFAGGDDGTLQQWCVIISWQ